MKILVWVKKLHLSVASSSGSREYIKAFIPFVSTTFVYNGKDRASSDCSVSWLIGLKHYTSHYAVHVMVSAGHMLLTV